MLKNANRVLKNSWTGGTTNVFKSQVVDSYIENNTIYSTYFTLQVSGLTTTTPLKVYYQTPSAYEKRIYTTNATHQPSFAATNESSYKKYFFFGKISGIYVLDFPNNNGTYRGDLIKLTEQFPVLKTLTVGTSAFNKNLNNTSFPSTLQTLALNDPTLSGDITKIKNFEKIEDLTFQSVLFSNSLTKLTGTNLKKIYLYALQNLGGKLNELVDNNPNFYYLYLWACPMWSGNCTTLNTSKLKYIQMYVAGNPAVTGSLTNWTFNTGLTNFNIYTSYVTGNLTNWNISNTKINGFSLYNFNSNAYKMSGSLSGWTMPTTLNSFNLYGVSGLTSTPLDFSNCPNFVSFGLNYCYALTQDLNTINFGTKLSTISIDSTKMATNLETWTMPTGLTQLVLRNSKFTGNVTGITLNNKLTYLMLENNKLSGQLANKVFPNTLTQLGLSYNTGITINLNLGNFNTNKLTTMYLNGIGGISGNLSNFPIPNNNTTLQIGSVPVSGNLTNLNPTKLYSFYAYGCSLNCDVTNWLTGTTSLYSLQIYSNPKLSGNTSNWNVNGIYEMYIQATKLSGALKHNNVRILAASSTKLSSNIRTDFNFSNRGYQVQLDDTLITGSLSGVTLNYGIYYFTVAYSPNVIGANHFVNYIFTNRSYWTYSSPAFLFQSIGDNVTGATESSGDTGTYYADNPGNNLWDLTEEQVNNLVIGTDYDGAGTNTKWNSKQKIYWMKNAKISHLNLNRRYVNFQIGYS